jgi:hypothetical protein
MFFVVLFECGNASLVFPTGGVDPALSAFGLALLAFPNHWFSPFGFSNHWFSPSGFSNHLEQPIWFLMVNSVCSGSPLSCPLGRCFG